MHKVTDTIPRASIAQVFEGLRFLAAQGGRTTFDAVRVDSLVHSRRKAPNTATAMWTVARDVLTELDRLKLATIGVLPRKLSDVERHRETPCQLLPAGVELADLHSRKTGQAYDTLLVRWLDEHIYFRLFILRIFKSALYVPDITNVGQLGLEAVKGKVAPQITRNLIDDCSARLASTGWSADKLGTLQVGIERRAVALGDALQASDNDAKRLVDVVQDGIVLPALLEAEDLQFDPVTFQQILKCAQEFLCAAWTTSYPTFEGRVVFPTCEFDKSFDSDPNGRVSRVVHHGVSYAEPLFTAAIQQAYIAVAGGSAAYVSAYSVRAIVCFNLKAPHAVFARCLQALISAGHNASIAVYTELPFGPPPQGESYVEVSGRRIGRLKLIDTKGG